MKVDNSQPKACVVGVGFVGLTLAISLCDAGFEVIGWEKDQGVSRALAVGDTEIIEPEISAKLKNYTGTGKFKMISSSTEAADAEVFIVTVGTPLKDSQIDLSHIEQAIEQLLPALKDNDLVIIRSTTAIGTCRDLVLPQLRASKKKILLAMCPERTVEGRALIEMSSLPQIIGSQDEVSFQAASRFFSFLGPEIVRVSSLEAAELAKLINNTYRDLMFAFGNEIADVALAYGINPSEVIKAANYNYQRSAIALPGISGGPCLEKDPWILVQSGRQKGISMEISSASRIVNEKTMSRFLDTQLNPNDKPSKISILGLAFKGNPLTQDLRGSAVFPLVKYLCKLFPKTKLVGFEPAGITHIADLSIEVVTSMEEAISDSDIIILLTNALSFDDSASLISSFAKRDCLILDFWNRTFNCNMLSTQKYVSWSGG